MSAVTSESLQRYEFLKAKARDPGPGGGLSSVEVNEYFELLRMQGKLTNPDILKMD